MDFDIGTITERIRVTPAERAVLVEQGEALKIETDQMIVDAKNGMHGDILLDFVRLSRITKNIEDVCSMAVRRTVEADE